MNLIRILTNTFPESFDKRLHYHYTLKEQYDLNYYIFFGCNIYDPEKSDNIPSDLIAITTARGK